VLLLVWLLSGKQGRSRWGEWLQDLLVLQQRPQQQQVMSWHVSLMPIMMTMTMMMGRCSVMKKWRALEGAQ
jgi:hypothetical protein